MHALAVPAQVKSDIACGNLGSPWTGKIFQKLKDRERGTEEKIPPPSGSTADHTETGLGFY